MQTFRPPLLTLTSARTEDLTPAAREAIIRVCVAAHQEQDFKNLFTYIPNNGLHFLAYQEDEIVSHAVVTTRWLQPEGWPLLRTAYVDAVATMPVLQGKGYGSSVMLELAHALKVGVGNYQIACLETDNPGFYTRLGWQRWRGPLAGRSAEGLIPTPGVGVMVLRLPPTPLLNLDSLLTIEIQKGRVW
ncbi:MAG: hypothetical protein Fur0022_31360 [Anaerolineales bacterium]